MRVKVYSSHISIFCFSIIQEESRKIQVCVAKTLQLLDNRPEENDPALYLQQAANQHSGIAAYMLWSQMKATLPVGN